MITKTWSTRYLTLCMTVALLALGAQPAFPNAGAQQSMGHLTVTGKVSVNGQPAANGDVVSSGSTVHTAKGSSAVVSLGKLGRVEVRAETRMTLNYSDSGISVQVHAGSARVCDGKGQCRDYQPG